MVAHVNKTIVVLILTGVITACLPINRFTYAPGPARPWVYADLRVIDPVDAVSPSLDIIALYHRKAGSDLQIRVDLLDIGSEPDADLYLALDWTPGGTRRLPLDAESDIAWEILLRLPADGQPAAYSAPVDEGSRLKETSTFIPRIVRDPLNDTLVISLPFAALQTFGRPISFQAFLNPVDSDQTADSTRAVRSDNPSPRRATVLLAFWNSFPAYTPAQGLRRWRGAHTGPLGGRHGLFALLSSVRAAQVPVILLDLKTPAALSALNYIDRLEVLRTLTAQRLVILPDVLPGFTTLPLNLDTFGDYITEPEPYLRAARDSRRTALEFGLPASTAVYSPSAVESIPRDYPLAFIPIQGNYPFHRAQQTLIPILPTLEGNQVTPEGLELAVRRQLVENALTPAELTPPILTLGGDLTASAWGVLTHARASMGYIAAHPWIKPLSYYDLAAYPVLNSEPQAGLLSHSGLSGRKEAQTAAIAESVLDFSRAPDNQLSEAAWQAYTSLLAPLPPEVDALPVLRAKYLPRIREILAAAAWVEDPQPVASCVLDYDLDGTAECSLASRRYYAVIDPLGGRLVYLFALAEDGPHQLIAPSTQFVVGLGDPSTWDLTAVENAEPAGYHGAFSDSPTPWQMYQPNVIEGGIDLTTFDGSRRKVFRLSNQGLSVEYHSADALATSIPLALDPWIRFSQGWDRLYGASVSHQSLSWGIATGGEVSVTTTANLRFEHFTASQEEINTPEDPNFGYPPGHYLPFPLAVVDINSEGDFSVKIDYNNP